MLARIMTSCVASALVLSAATGAIGAEAEKGTVTRVYNDNVAPADQVAYEAGVKAYNKCLADHGFKYTWTAWGHETGNTYLYSYVTGPHTWADFDKMQESGQACDDTWRKEANPHLKGEVSAFVELQPELSYPAKENPAKPFVMNVVFFKLKHGREPMEMWTENFKKIAAAAEKAKWPNHFTVQRVRSGGTDFPDYVLTAQYKTWADYGANTLANVWKMVEGVYGKQDTDAIRKALNDATEDITPHLDRYNADLTYTAPSK